jgi:hypothetical protein
MQAASSLIKCTVGCKTVVFIWLRAGVFVTTRILKWQAKINFIQIENTNFLTIIYLKCWL